MRQVPFSVVYRGPFLLIDYDYSALTSDYRLGVMDRVEVRVRVRDWVRARITVRATVKVRVRV